MSLDQVAFNDTKGAGYNKSSKGSSSVDIMGLSMSPSPSTKSLFDTGALTQPFAQDDPVYGQQQTLTQSLVEGNTRNETFMEMLHPDKDFSAANFKLADNTRDVNQKIADGSQIAKTTSNAEQENAATREGLKETHAKDMAQCKDALDESAVANECSAEAAENTFMPQQEMTKFSLALNAFLPAAAGVGYVVAELSKADKQLPAEKQKSILTDQLQILQSSSQQQDTRLSSASSAPKESANDAHWENFDIDDLEEFMATPFDELEEVKELDFVDNMIEMAQDNHRYIAENYASQGDLIGKGLHLAETGQSQVMQAQINQATVAQDIDAGSVELAGYALGGIVKLNVPDMSANDAKFANVTEISTRIDQSKMDMPVVQNQLHSYIQNEMRASFG